MKFIDFSWSSLKTRLTLLTLAIFLASMWTLAFIASRMLHADMERVMGEQMFSTVSIVAAQVDAELEEGLTSLKKYADGGISPAMLDNASALQTRLQESPIILELFNAGVYVTDTYGTAIASVPVSVGRVGVNYIERDHLAAALREGRANIGRPFFGKTLIAPIVAMAAPIKDGKGQVVGALVGVIDLSKPNFLDKITAARYGKTGVYLLVAPQHNLIITATDKSRIMQPVPAPGVNTMYDRYMQGFNGFGIALNKAGIEELSAAQRVPIAGWFVVAILPSAEAFAPVNDLVQSMLLTTLVLTLLAGGLTSCMLRRELLPLFTTASTLATLVETNLPPHSLPLTRQDETDQLIGGFNRLLQSLAQREDALQESERRYREMFESNPQPMWVYDVKSLAFLMVNDAAVARYGYSREEFLRMTIRDIRPAEDLPRFLGHMSQIRSGFGAGDLWRHCLKDGSTILVEVSSHSLMVGDHAARVVLANDVTARAMAEQALKESEEKHRLLVENSHDVIYTLTKAGIFTFVSPAWTTLMGHPIDQVVGQAFLPLVHPHDVAVCTTFMQKVVDARQPQEGIEFRVRHLNGDWRWFHSNAVPLKDETGEVLGLQGSGMDMTESKAAQEQIQNLAFSDPLTGLPNRRLLLDRLEQALSTGARHLRQGALLFLDLDDFKTLNDTLGHDLGDLLLQQVAQRLLACVREGDTVARVGGDEFVLLLDDLSNSPHEVATHAETVGEEIIAALNKPYLLQGQAHHSTSSIGITLFGGGLREAIAEPLKRAELAMYQAKAAGHNSLRFFEVQMQTGVVSRAALVADLRHALENNQFLLYYQAQVTDEHQISGAEALVRWLDPRRGMVSPTEFIPLAEETGLILPLGQWVLETACTQLTLWANQPTMAHLTLAVNVSARQFHQRDFVSKVLATLERTGANPSRLKIELTESLLVSNVEDVIAKMSALKGLGVSFSLDDFGTGYSSLSYLKRLPLDQLKIDICFVRDILTDPSNAAITKTVIDLAKNLGLVVIAEGVEVEGQRGLLARQGCHAYQGYLFSRPLSIEEFEAFVRRA